ncbi:MAG: DUF1189 family protein [Patescibacteria group bacterium]
MILTNIVRAIYDKTFYKESENDSFAKRFGTLYLLSLILSITVALSLGKFYYANRQNIQNFAQRLEKSLPSYFPKDLVLKIENGNLSTNQKEPFSFGNEIVYTFTDNKAVKNSGFNLVTIDTNGSIDNFESYRTFILLTQKGFAVKSSERSGKIEFYPYSQFDSVYAKEGGSKNVVFDYNKYLQLANKISPFAKSLPQLFSIIIFSIGLFAVLVAPLFSVLFWLMALLFLSLLGYIAAMVIKRPHTYGYVYKMSMYLAIPLIILQNLSQIATVMGLAGVPDFSPYNWLVYLLLLAIFIPESGDKVVMQANPLDPPNLNTNKQ